MENSILVRDLTKRFPDFTLDRVSFQVPQGRIVGFIGENGAGKSTTIRLILNELKRDGGTVELLGRDPADPAARTGVGVVFDQCNFPEVFTPLDVERVLSGVYPAWDKEAYRGYLRRFALPEKKRVKALSKGMKMKLAISAALAHQPKLLILDEATAGLDPVVRDEILDLLLDFIQDEEHSVFFSSHITSDIQKIADYVVLIHQGQIVFEEERDVLLDRYGILRCPKGAEVEPEDYIVRRETGVSAEYLVRDRAEAGRKYPKAVADAASLEDIMLFYIKGEASCGE
ncbi:ABC transporter ATP-binding protein [Oscillibacter sp.]|uniref:ABC transporter ATP-binding protein n=1 Tax=Oscillibacter sp. TaxID=1945593 RepID=UPI002D80B530|nr:ABC transporter ATP-binding protein [Oscillibacter sp.]